MRSPLLIIEQPKDFYIDFLEQQSKNFKFCVKTISEGGYKKDIRHSGTQGLFSYRNSESHDKVSYENLCTSPQRILSACPIGLRSEEHPYVCLENIFIENAFVEYFGTLFICTVDQI